MLRYELITIVATMLLLTAVAADANNSSALPKTPPKSNLDVTMNVVPLNSDIEKTVVQTITLPIITPTNKLHKQNSKAKAGAVPSATQQPSKSGIDSIENTRASVLRQTAEARHEAAETTKEARKDSNNSSAPDNDTPPLG
ncbi:MAG TPA: hypothetical protein VNI53_08945 [Gammaproteobacteria bacterium]|nr:hypothetical protein [Gammaproteobacteria bacterium]